MSHEGEGDAGDRSPVNVKTFPLNSRRLTADNITRIAKGLELPTTASQADTRQMIEGKLAESHQTKNVLVDVIGPNRRATIRLRDEQGVILEVPPEEESSERASSGSEAGGGDLEREVSPAEVEISGHPRGGARGGGVRSPDPELAVELRSRTVELESELKRVHEANQHLEEEKTGLLEEVRQLKESMQREREKYTTLWRMNCEQFIEQDKEIETLQSRVLELEMGSRVRHPEHTPLAHLDSATDLVPSVSPLHGARRPEEPAVGRRCPVYSPSVPSRTIRGAGEARRGKAPPIDPFSGESPDVLFEDWLPALRRAAEWNRWSNEETLIQLAGHLRGRALQEWGLLSAHEKASLDQAVTTMRNRLDPCSRALAAQDFRHTCQQENESVADFIRRLEQMFKLAYGRDGMSDETRGNLLHSQLQEGLRYEIMEAPAVSGSHGYKELCLAVRNEEKRLVELAKRRQYLKNPVPSTKLTTESSGQFKEMGYQSGQLSNQPPRFLGPNRRTQFNEQFPRRSINSGIRCFNCGKPGHYSRECWCPRTESSGRGTDSTQNGRGTRQVQTAEGEVTPAESQEPANESALLSCLESEGEGVRQVRINDLGSRQQHADVQLEGVPARGVIDSGADITILGGELFRRVAAVARLKKSQLKKSDKVPRTYDRRTFTLDGKMDLDISFGGTTMRTPVYIKMDAPEQLLLSEGVCRQLDIISYHPGVVPKPQTTQGHQVETPSLAESEVTKTRGDGTKTQGQPMHQSGVRKKPQPDDTHEGDQPRLETRNPTSGVEGNPQTESHSDTGRDAEVNNQGSMEKSGGGRHRRRRGQRRRWWRSRRHRGNKTREQDQNQTETGMHESGTEAEELVEQTGRAGHTKVPNASEDPIEELGGNSKRYDGVRNCGPNQTHKESDGGTHSDAVVPDIEAASCTVHTTNQEEYDAIVPMVRVTLIQSLRVLPSHSVLADVKVEGALPSSDPLLLQYNGDLEQSLGVSVGDTLIRPSQEGNSCILVMNRSGFTRYLEGGETLGEAVPVEVVCTGPTSFEAVPCKVGKHSQVTDIRDNRRIATLEEVEMEQLCGPSGEMQRNYVPVGSKHRGEEPNSNEEDRFAPLSPLNSSEDNCREEQEVDGCKKEEEKSRSRHATEVQCAMVVAGESFSSGGQCKELRRRKLREALTEPDLPQEEKETLLEFLATHHHIFSLEEGERGETDLIQMKIDTGEAHPKKQPPRRLPFAVRQEVARQLNEMQNNGVIQPSKSPWASPVVLVRKKDGTHRFCVDYCGVNSVTKPDSFPLPRIEDLLDQLGKSKYFSTIDFASGFWQIRMHPTAQEKTAFVTRQGLFEFRVMPFGLTNAPATFQRLMQQVVTPLNPSAGPDFVSAYLDDILVFSPSLEEHLRHLKIVILRLVDVGLKLKPSKCRFAQKELEYLGHVVSRDGLKTNPQLVEAVRSFPVPQTVQDTRRFLGLSSYYRKFIPKFSKIARPLHYLTHKDARFEWSLECDKAFEELKQKLTTAPVLAYPDFQREFVLETDASIQGIGAVLGQYQDDKTLHPIAYASRALSAAEKHYSITELETLAVVWAITHFHHHLYGNVVTVYTDHVAVKAVLETPNPTGKHARWWSRVYGRGVRQVRIVYRAGKENKNADALSRSPLLPAPAVGIGEDEVQVSSLISDGGVQASSLRSDGEVQVSFCEPKDGLTPSSVSSGGTQHQILATTSSTEANKCETSGIAADDGGVDPISDIRSLFQVSSSDSSEVTLEPFANEQRKDLGLKEIIEFIESGKLPDNEVAARKLALQESLFIVCDGILYFLDPKHKNRKRAVVPKQLRNQILHETHSSSFGGHFSGHRLYNCLAVHWWWGGMFKDAVKFAKACPECAIVTGTGRKVKPALHPIPVSRPFQILGIDVMDLPLTERGNKHVVVIQDLFTKWPFVFAVPDQKTTRIARLLAEEVIPCFGVPECLLSDRGTNLLSNLMLDLCKMLGVTKLNTTAYHPQCDGAVERFNRTLKTSLRKHAARFGCQWDNFLPGILWAYRNTPHTSTGEKPSFLLYGVDCRSPTEAAYLPASEVNSTDVSDYREELMLSLSSARELAATSIQTAQARYKRQYDRNAREANLRLGDWVLIRFPQDESGRWRKLSRPWHGPFRVVSKSDPDVTCVKVYFPQDDKLCVHQSRVCHCPAEFPAGYYWYGGKRKGPGRPPKWVDQLLHSGPRDDRAMQDVQANDTDFTGVQPTAGHPREDEQCMEDPLESEVDKSDVAKELDKSTECPTRDAVPPEANSLGRRQGRLRGVTRPPDRLM